MTASRYYSFAKCLLINYSLLAVAICAPDQRKRPSAIDTLLSKLKDQLVERIFYDDLADRS